MQLECISKCAHVILDPIPKKALQRRGQGSPIPYLPLLVIIVVRHLRHGLVGSNNSLLCPDTRDSNRQLIPEGVSAH